MNSRILVLNNLLLIFLFVVCTCNMNSDFSGCVYGHCLFAKTVVTCYLGVDYLFRYAQNYLTLG